MAKVLDFTNNQGINFTESYWRVVSIYLDLDRKSLDYTVNCYKDNKARTDNLAPITSRNYSITENLGFNNILTEINDKTKNPLEIAYEKLNGDGFFEGSSDV